MRKRTVPKKTSRVMPIQLQIYKFTQLFLKANEPYYRDVSSELDKIDHWDNVVEGENFHENLANLKDALPQYYWELPKKKKSSSVRDLHIWEKRIAGSLEIYTLNVPIKAHSIYPRRKSKSGTVRKYPEKVYGRIQLTVDKKWIGKKAKIIVRMPR